MNTKQMTTTHKSKENADFHHTALFYIFQEKSILSKQIRAISPTNLTVFCPVSPLFFVFINSIQIFASSPAWVQY